MGQKSLQAVVVLGGRVDNSFTHIGDALLGMASTVDEISQKLINFGKESINVYREYQDSMLDAEVALSTTYGRGTRELKAVMTELDAQATEWAASTIFHTDDVANAISEAAHANWDLDKILTGIPTAMRLAQAGSLDLSEALNYIVKTSNAAGIAFEDMPGFIDEWIYAANSSAGTVETFGDAMLRMGATMKFAGSQEELLTLLAALHDAGAEGSEAGTLLRNSLIRLVAPTAKAQKALAQLGVSQQEVDAAMAETDGNAKEAAEKLKAVGFSAYDQQGNLKGFTDIFTDLALATEKMSDKERNDVLSAIFPTRTITGALNMLEAAKKGWNGLLDALQGGDAEGYGKYGAETMMKGLTGSIETFNSKVERLKQLTGKSLEGDVTGFLGIAGDFIDSIAGMDERSFNALVGGLEGIAAIGPGLTMAGFAFHFLGRALGTTTGRIVLTATALAALYKAADSVAQYDYESKFGSMTLNSQAIEKYLNTVKQPFIEARKELEAYNAAMDAAVAQYTAKSSELAQGIITKMVTGTELTDEEKNSFRKMGDEIYNSLIDGIKNGYEATNQTLVVAAGGKENALADRLFLDINAAMQLGYENAISEAGRLSQELRSAMTSAFEDGQLTGDEVANIQAIMDEMNSLLAMETNAAYYAKERSLMRKAQTLGIEGLNQLKQEVDASRDEVLNATLEDQDRAYGQVQANLEFLRGREVNGNLVDQTYIDGILAGLEETFGEQTTKIQAAFQGVLIKAYDNALNSSELSDTASFIGSIAEAVRNGEADAEATMEELAKTKYAKGARGQNQQYARYLNEAIAAFGGEETTAAIIRQYKTQGDTETAAMAQRMLDAWRLYYQGDYSSFHTASSNNAAMEKTTPSWDEKKTQAHELIGSLYKEAEAQAEETKKKLDETLSPQEIEVQFPDAENNAKALHDGLAAIFTPIYQDVIITKKGSAGTSSGSAGTGGGILGNLISGVKSLFYAEGGRSDEPAIFGEGATAEWAIPEAHTMRTASLLTAAAQASGFSWGELAGASSGSGITVQYSPVIHSDNVGDIDRVLREDKSRFQKLIESVLDERRLYESVVSYG